MRRAERCVRGFERRKAKQLRRKDWGVCSLSFPNPSQERTFQYYSAQLRERNMRGCMLLLAFAYCLYATLEWRDAVGYSLSISRGTYVAAILVRNSSHMQPISSLTACACHMLFDDLSFPSLTWQTSHNPLPASLTLPD
jgi:hypothetical protein